MEFVGADHFIPHRVEGNEELDFEKYTTFSGGLQWDFAGIHIARGLLDDVRSTMRSAPTIRRRCSLTARNSIVRSRSTARRRSSAGLSRAIDTVESSFDNVAEVDTNGVDGTVNYTLDTKRRGLGDIGVFTIGVHGHASSTRT